MDSRQKTSSQSKDDLAEKKDYFKTFLLVLILLVAIGGLIYVTTSYQDNFIGSIESGN